MLCAAGEGWHQQHPDPSSPTPRAVGLGWSCPWGAAGPAAGGGSGCCWDGFTRVWVHTLLHTLCVIPCPNQPARLPPLLLLLLARLVGQDTASHSPAWAPVAPGDNPWHQTGSSQQRDLAELPLGSCRSREALGWHREHRGHKEPCAVAVPCLGQRHTGTKPTPPARSRGLGRGHIALGVLGTRVLGAGVLGAAACAPQPRLSQLPAARLSRLWL